MVTDLRRGRISGVFAAPLMSFVALSMISGCGGGDPDKKATAKVTGKVTYEGKPVTGGILTFAPVGGEKGKVAGKSGQAVIGSDGSYTVTTYTDGDGAVVGQHTLLFAPPSAPAPSAAAHADGKSAPLGPPPFAGLSPKTPEVKVVSGTNKIDIELDKSTLPPRK